MHLPNRKVFGPYPSTKKNSLLHIQTLNPKKILNVNIFYPMGIYIIQGYIKINIFE